MTIQEAIAKAVDGGYKDRHIWEIEDERYILVNDLGQRSGSMGISDILLDPLFWQCLGKAMGWIDKDYPNGEMRCDILVKGERRCDDRYCSYAGYIDPVSKWHALIDHLASGGTVEEYFATL